MKCFWCQNQAKYEIRHKETQNDQGAVEVELSDSSEARYSCGCSLNMFDVINLEKV